MEKHIYHLYTKLFVNECMNLLNEQVQPMTFWSRFFFFSRRTSKVVGRVSDREFMLEASRDIFSKRMHGRFVERQSGTIIEFEWQISFWSRLYGFHKFDEAEILSFLKEWLDAEPVQASSRLPK